MKKLATIACVLCAGLGLSADSPIESKTAFGQLVALAAAFESGRTVDDYVVYGDRLTETLGRISPDAQIRVLGQTIPEFVGDLTGPIAGGNGLDGLDPLGGNGEGDSDESGGLLDGGENGGLPFDPTGGDQSDNGESGPSQGEGGEGNANGSDDEDDDDRGGNRGGDRDDDDGDRGRGGDNDDDDDRGNRGGDRDDDDD